MQDTYRHKGLRKKLIDTLRAKGIQDERILQAFSLVPRHYFLDKAFEEWAYADKPFPIGNKQTISQPYTVAYQTNLLELKKREKVLEIGTGSGFQAAILATLGVRVFTVERQETLYKKTKKLLKVLGLSRIHMFLKDGMEGLPEFAPYDKILVTAAADKIPTALLSQLKVGGILVIPIGKERQQMCKIIKESEQQYKRIYLDYFKFVPLLKGTQQTVAQSNG